MLRNMLGPVLQAEKQKQKNILKQKANKTKQKARTRN